MLNNLVFRLGEYEDSLILSEMMVKEQFQVTLNAKTICHAIVEIYASTEKEVMRHLAKGGIGGAKNLTIVADFWTCKTQSTKYLGVRFFFVDHNWKLSSVLLGTRKFQSSYGERSEGLRTPFRAG